MSGFDKPLGKSGNTCMPVLLAVVEPFNNFRDHQSIETAPEYCNLMPHDWRYLQAFIVTAMQFQCSQHEWSRNCNWWNEDLGCRQFVFFLLSELCLARQCSIPANTSLCRFNSEVSLFSLSHLQLFLVFISLSVLSLSERERDAA